MKDALIFFVVVLGCTYIGMAVLKILDLVFN